MKKPVGNLIAAALAASLATPALAERVDLTSTASGFVISGELIRFDGQNYVIRNAVGQLTIDGYSVTCAGPGCPKTSILQTSFGVFGSNAIGATLMPELIGDYSAAQNGSVEQAQGAEATQVLLKLRDGAGAELASIDLRAGGSAAAFPGLISGEAAIGMSSRPVSPDEFDALESAGIREITREDTEHVLALDGLSVLVAPTNPLKTINIEDIADVFSGDVANWSELGGPDQPITVYARPNGAGARATLEDLVLTPRGVSLTADAVIVGSDAELSDRVARDLYGIGVAGLAFERDARALAVETACGLVVEPTPFNVKTEEYPLSRRLFLYTTGAPLPPPARGLLDYALSDAAQPRIDALGFVDQSISAIPLNLQGRRIAEAFIQPRETEALRLMRELALELLDAERLSATLRFRPGSSVLDVKSKADVRRLARMAAAGELEGREMLLIGFADDAERLEQNVTLSRQRALQIRTELEAAIARVGAPAVDLIDMGFGPLAPVACGEGALGGASNRRVEVWVRDQL